MAITTLPTDAEFEGPKALKPGLSAIPDADKTYALRFGMVNSLLDRVKAAFTAIGLDDGTTVGSLRALLGSSVAYASSPQTADGTYGIHRVTNAGGVTAITLSTTNWRINEVRYFTKENTSGNPITLAPPSGGTIQGLAVDAIYTLPGSGLPSGTTTADMRWAIVRNGALAFRCISGGDLRYDTSSAAEVIGSPLTALRLRTSNDGSTATPAVGGTVAGRGMSFDATKGVFFSDGGVDRFKALVSGTCEISSGVGGGTPVLRLLTNAVDNQFFLATTTPEGAFTASPGDICFDVTNGRLYLKRTGTGNTGWAQIDRCESGTWTPTYTAVSNLDSVSGSSGFYIRVGDRVHYAFRASVDPTLASPFQFRASLPIASNFTNVADAFGVQSSAGGSFAGRIQADTTNDAFVFDGNTFGTTSVNIDIVGCYQVI